MKQKKGKYSSVIPIGIIVSILGLAFFVFMHLYSLSNAAAFETDPTEPLEQVSDIPKETPQPPPPSPTPMPRPEPTPPEAMAYRPRLTGDEYATIQMDESDIHRGYLLLINAEHSYEIPDDLGLVSMASARTVPYGVASSHVLLQGSIMRQFDDMVQAFIDETNRNIIYVLSAYRDYAAQRSTLNQYIAQEGREAALRRAKEPGHSEHHTGLALDLATFANGEQQSFTYFDVTRWFPQNSYKYGFILRYARDKVDVTKTIYEPWHYRYVGMPHSHIMFNRNWALEEYIDEIRQHSADNPFLTEYDGVSYEVYFTENRQITVPIHAIVNISGNNIDGFIVTIYHRYDRITNVSAQ